MRFGKTEVEKKKKEFYDVIKSIKIKGVDVDNILISKLIETKWNYLNCLNEIICGLISISPKVNGYVTTFKFKDRKLISLSIDNDKPFEKYKTIWTKTEDWRNIKPNALRVPGMRYI